MVIETHRQRNETLTHTGSCQRSRSYRMSLTCLVLRKREIPQMNLAVEFKALYTAAVSLSCEP